MVLEQQQGQHLDGLAQPHVISQTRAEPEPRQQVQPLQAGALIGSQCAAQRRAGIDASAIRGAQRPQCLGEPRPGRHLRPVGTGRLLLDVIADRSAREHAHRLSEAQPLLRRQRLGLAELLHRTLQPRAVHLHPLAA
jgi:hypothetical protein